MQRSTAHTGIVAAVATLYMSSRSESSDVARESLKGTCAQNSTRRFVSTPHEPRMTQVLVSCASSSLPHVVSCTTVGGLCSEPRISMKRGELRRIEAWSQGSHEDTKPKVDSCMGLASRDLAENAPKPHWVLPTAGNCSGVQG